MAIVNGTAGNDTLTGTAGSDTVSGFGGNDSLTGSGGVDWVEGGLGNDTVRGGSGQDSLVFREAGTANADLLEDYASNYDNIQLDAAFFSAIGASGRFASGDARFWSSTSGTAHDANDRIVLNTSSGQLWYDADGNGSGAAQLIATLPAGRTVIASDIWVFGTPPQPGQTINGTPGNDSLLGGQGNDTINGFAGEDTIDGGLGADSMIGGAHADTYFVDHPGDVIVEFENGGIDLVVSSISYTLPAWVNNLRLEPPITTDPDGSPSFVGVTGTGNELDNVITGATPWHHSNALDGADGNDTLIGGDGGDTFYFQAGSGNYGHDVIDGGDEAAEGGEDGVTFYSADGQSYARSGVVIDFLAGTITGGGAGGAGSATFVDLEWAEGGAFDDVLIANHGFQHTDPGGGFFGGPFLYGGEGNDTIWGGNAFDSLQGDAGNDEIHGGDTGDGIDGGAGADRLFGDAGNDVFLISGAAGSDTIDGGEGNDSLFTESADSAVNVNLGAGTMTGGGTSGTTLISIESVQGTRFNDLIVGSSAANRLHGGIGNDTIDGGLGNDTLAGSNFVFMDDDPDSFVFSVSPGSANADFVADFWGTDKLVLDARVHANAGASGNFAEGDARFWSSGTGTAHDADDRVIYNTSTGELWYDADGNGTGAAQLIATLDNSLAGAPALATTNISIVNGSSGGGQVINGTSGADTLSGTVGNDTINGLGGNDLVLAGSSGGADMVNGGVGFDSIEFASRATSAMVVDYAAGTITGGSSGSISFTGIERVVAGGFNDSLTGNGAAQNLSGYAGADTLWGAGGIDTLWGGGGADTFIFRETGTANADSVRDWASGSDKVALDNSPMSALGAMGNFAAGDARFWSSSTGTAHDANDRVIYNTSTGSLYYDADGSGAGAAQIIATFQGAPGVAATDITVI